MIRQRFSVPMVLVLVITQVLGTGLLWAAEQRGIQIDFKDYVVISAISEGLLIAESSGESKVLRFGEAVNVGEELRTGKNTVAEVLIGNRAVVTLGGDTTAQVTKLSADQLTIQVTKGMVRVAASANALGEKDTVIIQTPTSQVKTRGGIVRVMVNVISESVAQTPVGEAKPYLASYSPQTIVAANNADTDIIQVEEGGAEILGAGPDGESLAITSGQRVTRQAGQAGLMTKGEQPGTMRASVLAKADHNNTPKEGLENLVALQVDQATQLGQVLTGASKTETQDAEKKGSKENPVNGATGGVQVASAVVNTLFGGGSASNSRTFQPSESTGSGFTGLISDITGDRTRGIEITTNVNGPNRAADPLKTRALLVFTSKDPLRTIVKNSFTLNDGTMLNPGAICTNLCFNEVAEVDLDFERLAPVVSEFTAVKELVLVGGTPNNFHDGIVPSETLIIRGASPFSPAQMSATNQGGISGGFNTSSTLPDLASIGSIETDTPDFDFPNFFTPIITANSTLVPENFSGTFEEDDPVPLVTIFRGTFDDFTRNPSGAPRTGRFGNVDGAITATSTTQVPVVNLTGGVTLDRGTIAAIGETTATDNYFSDPIYNIPNAETFNGSLLAVIDGPNTVSTAVTVDDRLLGVYDGSQILTPEGAGNKALLSVLDAKLKGPTNGAPLLDINAAFKDANPNTPNRLEDVDGRPNVAVTSAVVTRSTMPLDGALLEASAPILALTMADMTTTSHFAGVVGKLDDMANRPLSLKLNDVMVALNASTLMIENGNLLNLNNASATLGYLFSLNGSSTLRIGVGEGNGTLFSLANGAELQLTANALGVFGNGNNTLAIKNNLCAGPCGNLVNTAGEVFKLPNGSTLQAAGVTQDVVLPDGFNPFAQANGGPMPNITVEGALFEVKAGSTLTIDGTAVVN